MIWFADNWLSVFPAIGAGVGTIATMITILRAQSRAKSLAKENDLSLREKRSAEIELGKPPTRDATKLVAEHDSLDRRWVSYETDIARLLDFPMMTDMREELTVTFHKAKHRAYLLRPESPETLTSDQKAYTEYREAVHDYVSAFAVAESEAMRRRRTYFSEDEQERMARAQKLMAVAQDDGATLSERQTAYKKAQRELEGILVLPARTLAAIEHHITPAIEVGS